MSELTQQLDKMIQKAALDGALTEDAVEQFHELVKANESQRKQLSSLRDEMVQKERVLELVQQERNDARTARDALLEKEAKMDEALAQDELLQMTVRYEQKRVDDHKSMVGLIFRNTVLKKQAVTPGHAGHVDQYGNVQNQDYPSTHNLEEEET
jgi:malate synthase